MDWTTYWTLVIQTGLAFLMLMLPAGAFITVVRRAWTSGDRAVADNAAVLRAAEGRTIDFPPTR